MGQGAGVVQLLSAALDLAVGGELAQQTLELGTVGVLHPEGAGNLARADLSRLRADEGEKVVLGRERRSGVGALHEGSVCG